MSPVIQQIPSDLARPIKDLKLGNAELLKTSKEILAADQELIAKSNKQIEELEKINREVAKLDPVAPVLIFYRSQFFYYHTTTEGTVLGPYNLEKYSTLSGYLYPPTSNLIIRVEYRDAAYPEGGFISQDEWGMGTGSLGALTSFNLPIRGPWVRLKFQGQTEGSSSISLQANQTKGLPKFLASLTPLIKGEESLGPSAAKDFQIYDIVSGPINYVLNCGGGMECALIIYLYPIPEFPLVGTFQVNNNPAVSKSYTLQGILNLGPFPSQMRLYNLGASTQLVQGLLWQN